MPIPGLTDAYAFVDWLKARKYHVEHGEGIEIRGEAGGLIMVRLHKADLEFEQKWKEHCDMRAAQCSALIDVMENSPEKLEKIFQALNPKSCENSLLYWQSPSCAR